MFVSNYVLMLFHVGALREKQAPTVHTLILLLLAIYQMNSDTLSCVLLVP